MRTMMRALSGCQVVVARLLTLAVLLAAVGCATTYPGSYMSALPGTQGTRFNVREMRVEHNLFNSRYQMAKEDWEED